MRAETGTIPRGAIRLTGVGKTYAASGRPVVLRRSADDRFAALDDVDLRVEPGEAVGVIGPNGAGKTTLLRIIAGVTSASSGEVRRGGTVTSMIELGLGFHPEMSGWANLECSAMLLGVSRREARRLAEPIAEFSGIADALDDDLRTYSTGMRARLGFAIATHVPSDVLVIDEVLAVGDREFQVACIERARQLVAEGTTLLFVSHEMPLVTQVCDRAVHIRQGSIVDDGPAREVVQRYLEPTSSRLRTSAASTLHFLDCALRATAIAPLQPLEIGATIEVRSTPVDVQLGLDFLLPSFDPDAVRFSISTPLAGIDRPGRYRVTGRSDPYPADSGLVQAHVNLVDAGAHRLADQRIVEFQVVGAPVEPRHRLASVPRWSMSPIDPPGHSRTLAAEHDDRHDGSAAAVQARGATKRYRSRAGGPVALLRGPTRLGRRIVALDRCTLDLRPGETTGVIGPNGAGKSTLLRLIAGVTRPEEGSVTATGRVVPVLQLGLGFHPNLSGNENVRISGRLLGLDAQELEARLDEIVDFAGLGAVMDQPVRTYSAGMAARLGFSLAVHCDPDVLLLDEILAVGDEEFRKRAVRRVRELRDRGVAIVFVSHDLGLIEEVSDRVVRFDHAVITDDGDPAAVVERFGGRAWAAGSSEASAGVRFHSLNLHRRVIPTGAALTFDGVVEVADPSPHARIELSLRVPLEDRSRVLDRREFESRCIFVATVQRSGSALAEAGWYRFVGAIDQTPMSAELDVVVSVVDERDGTVIGEFWQGITIGRVQANGMPRMELGFRWETELLEPL